MAAELNALTWHKVAILFSVAKDGLSGLHIEDPYSFDEWTAHCRELIVRNKVSDGILRLHITRGTGKRGYSSMGSSTPTVPARASRMVTARPSQTSKVTFTAKSAEEAPTCAT